jgi:SAM-dependent MidA family methyltransferase
MGAPANISIIELGPVRGTLMKDALRAAEAVPAFRDAIAVHFVEISPVLVAQQKRTLEHLTIPMSWHSALEDVPADAAIVIANEFFDALPISQAVKSERGWHQRQIGIDDDGNLAFTIACDPIPLFERRLPPAIRAAPEHSIFEWRADTMAMDLGRRIADGGGAALVIDYGHAASAVGETLQAVGQHVYAKPMTMPGNIDLTAHVDFQPLLRAAEAMGAKVFGPIEQSHFLRRLGIETRAATLKVKATRAGSAEVDAALERLIGHGRTGMGELFKVAALTHPSVGVPPGFES